MTTFEDDLKWAWVVYRKEYEPNDINAAYKAFVAGWKAAYGLQDEGIQR